MLCLVHHTTLTNLPNYLLSDLLTDNLSIHSNPTSGYQLRPDSVRKLMSSLLAPWLASMSPPEQWLVNLSISR